MLDKIFTSLRKIYNERIDLVKNDNKKILEENGRLKTRNNELQEKIDSITKENEIILQDNKRLEVKTDELLKNNTKIRNSVSFKIGMIATFIPRTISEHLLKRN